MTEQEWLTCDDPQRMLHHLTYEIHKAPDAIGDHPRAVPLLSDRKLRLFAAACCRQVWDLLTDSHEEPCGVFLSEQACAAGKPFTHYGNCPSCHGTGVVTVNRSRNAVEVAERFADGEATEEEYIVAHGNMNCVPASAGDFAVWLVWSSLRSGHSAADNAVRACEIGHSSLPQSHKASILRDIAGNPFRSVPALPYLYTGDRYTIHQLARAMYESRDFAAMPQLGDALEEAGCTDEEILRHCRKGQTYRQVVTVSVHVDQMYLNDDGKNPPRGWAVTVNGKKEIGALKNRKVAINYAESQFSIKSWDKYTKCWVGEGVITSNNSIHARGCWVLDLCLGKE